MSIIEAMFSFLFVFMLSFGLAMLIASAFFGYPEEKSEENQDDI